MKYILRIHALGKYPEVELDKSRYEAIKKARTMLSDGLAMEEKYEILISNYLEFEKEILEHAAQLMIRHPHDYYDFFQVRMSFNRRLVNLLTAARLYVDQLHRHVRADSPDSQTAKEEVASLFSREYDNSLEYRFMEALRNYVQHQGIPVHWVQFYPHADTSGEKKLLIYSMELASQKELLQEDHTFKKSVLEEIPEKVDLKTATRVYVEGISRVHCAARKLVEQSLAEARSIIEDAIASCRQVFSKEFVGLHAICLDENKIVESVPLLLDWDDVRIKLSKRNSELVNLRNRYVSGQGKSHNK
jgi:hypothetical protein